MKDLAKNIKALGNERRLKIVALLVRGPARSVGDLAEHMSLSLRSTSRHLQVLRSVGIVEGEQVGLLVLYHVNRAHPVMKAILPLMRK